MYDNIETLSDPKVDSGIRINSIRHKIMDASSNTLEFELKSIADVMKSVLVNAEWKEYVDAYVSHGQYGNEHKICFHGSGSVPLRFTSFNKWIENGLGLMQPKKVKPVQRLILRIQTLFPPDKHQELISAVYDAAANAGEPMSKADRAKLAIENRWNHDTSTINSTSIDENQRHSTARHLAKLKAADESLYRQVQSGEKSLGTARIEAGLSVKTYSFNATTRVETLAGNIHQAFADQPEKITNLIRTLIVAHCHDQLDQELMHAIIEALNQPQMEAIG